MDDEGKTQRGDGTARAYRELRSAILSGELAPGSVFSQVQIAADIGVSRTPLREAIRLLQTEGLVESEARRQVRVTGLDLGDLDVLYAMRILLEPLGVFETVPKLTDQDLEEIEQAQKDIAEGLEKRAFGGSVDAHRRFHFGLFRYAGDRLRRLLADLWDHAERYRGLYMSDPEDQLALAMLAAREHREIFDSAAQRDAEACSELIARHLSRTALTVFAKQDQRHHSGSVRHALEMTGEKQGEIEAP